MAEPWGAGPGLLKRFERSNANHVERKRMLKAEERRKREARRKPLTPRQKRVNAWVGGAVIVAIIVAAVVSRVVAPSTHRTPSMSNLELSVQYRADLALRKDGYSQTIKSVLCVPAGTRQARCGLTASNGVKTAVTAYISSNGKSFVTGP